MKVNIKTYELQNFILEKISEKLETDLVLVNLNTKKDLLHTGIKNKAFLQYIGIDYKERKGAVKYVIYVSNKSIYNNNNSISESLDDIRKAITEIELENNVFGNFDYCYLDENRLSILEEKYNNTETLDFIYSIVFSVNVVI